jgi:hypothetical protein
MQREIATGIGSVCLLGLCLWPLSAVIAPEPSSELLRYMAALGGTFAIAYAIELSSVVRGLRFRGSDQEAYLGVIISTGLCGLLSIGLSLAVSERAALKHWAPLDQIAFSFSIGSLVLLGLIIVLLPALAYDRKRLTHLDPDD